MYDPARDIFTENRPSSSPPTESYDLSALDTLADLAAEAEIASLPVNQDIPIEPINENANEIVQEPATENKTVNHVKTETSPVDSGVGAVPVGGVEVAGTKEPVLTLKVTLHLKKDRQKPRRDDMLVEENIDPNDGSTELVTKEEKIAEYKVETSTSPMKEDAPEQPSKWRSPKSESPKDTFTRKDDPVVPEDARNEKGDSSYPIPLSLSRLTKIPKRKTEERRDRPDREQNRSRTSDRERKHTRPSRSPPPYSSRSPSSYRPKTPPRRLSDDRYRPNPQPLIDSYRPSRDRDHYSPPKRPRSPSPPRQLKRPVRRDITAEDRERERRERQLREAERQKAELDVARSRPIYEAVRQHYNEREERGREARQESRIFRLRKFNNWIKSVLIAKFIPERTEEEIDEERGLFVLDIGCGKGGDLGKWQKQPQVQAYVGVDLAEVSIIHAEQRAADLRGRRFSTKFFAMDCFVVTSILT